MLKMDLLVSGWSLKSIGIAVLPPTFSAKTCSCSFYMPPGSARKFTSPFWTHPLSRIPNKFSSPIAIHARKKNSKSESFLKPTIVEEVSMGDEEEELLFDDFEDGNFVNIKYPFVLCVCVCDFYFF